MRKLLSITAAALMCTTGLALAADNPSGRPGQVLNQEQCQQAWDAAGPNGGNLSEASATPYVLNFAALDTSNDGKISSEEWQAGCNKGWVSADAREATPLADPAGKASGVEAESDDAMSSDKDKSSY